MGAFNQLTVVCEDEACPHSGREQVVSLPLVGPGLFLKGTVVCECGCECRVVDEG